MEESMKRFLTLILSLLLLFLFLGVFFAHPLHRVLYLAYQEIDFQTRFRLTGLQVRHYDVGQDLAEMHPLLFQTASRSLTYTVLYG